MTIHFPNRFQKKRRVSYWRLNPAFKHSALTRRRPPQSWVELRSDTITWATSSHKAAKSKILGSCRLSQCKEIKPYVCRAASRLCSSRRHYPQVADATLLRYSMVTFRTSANPGASPSKW